VRARRRAGVAAGFSIVAEGFTKSNKGSRLFLDKKGKLKVFEEKAFRG